MISFDHDMDFVENAKNFAVTLCFIYIFDMALRWMDYDFLLS